MRLLIIRHGDPDYERDCLTEQGKLEAELLADALENTRIDAAYVSPLGRARLTAKPVLERKNIEPEILYWLREFDAKIRRPDRPDDLSIAWDWLPADMAREDDFYNISTWENPAVIAKSDAPKKYKIICENLDALLDSHGYRRDGRIYRAHEANNKTIAFFCHFGLESVILSRLLNISPMLLWHGFCALTSSVTTVYTEERRQGIASFRVSEYGDISHLKRAGVEPSFSARFCERFDDIDSRHD